MYLFLALAIACGHSGSDSADGTPTVSPIRDTAYENTSLAVSATLPGEDWQEPTVLTRSFPSEMVVSNDRKRVFAIGKYNEFVPSTSAELRSFVDGFVDGFGFSPPVAIVSRQTSMVIKRISWKALGQRLYSTRITTPFSMYSWQSGVSTLLDQAVRFRIGTERARAWSRGYWPAFW
jgi:hypothetical protein